MKKHTLLILLFTCKLLFQTISFGQTSESQIEYYNAHLNDLKDKNGNNIFDFPPIDSIIMYGETLNNNFGCSVASAGDVNGDGYSDIIVGANGYNSNMGRAYIFYGGSSTDNVADIILTGETINDAFGNSVSNAGDVNGDGYSDVMVGSSNYNSNIVLTGRVYIYYGGSSMNNVADVIMTGEVSYSGFGASVSTAGDVNADGYSDVIVGAPNYGNYRGRAYIFFGGVNMDNISDVIMTGESINSIFGRSVSTCGDVNGDGYSDVIVGSYVRERAYIYFGDMIMDNIADVNLTDIGGGGGYGYSVCKAGDVNGDGYSDIIVAAPFYAINTGRAYIYYGGSSMNSVADITLTGESNYDNFGISVSSAGDINKDGYSDVIVGANGYSTSTGRAYFFYGGSAMNNIADITLTGETVNNNFGISLSYVNDVNGDGYPDAIVGENSNDSQTGRAYLYFNLIPKQINLNIKLIFEGMYYPLFNQMSRKDSVIAFLHQVSPPYNTVDSAIGTVDSVLFTGLFKFFKTTDGTFYISVKHFNTLETWSKVNGESLSNNGTIFYNYDFTTSSSKAYGNNLKLKGSKYCIYSGDADQSGFIDVADIIFIFNDATALTSGRFLSTDLNGDNFVDTDDLIICYNNLKNFIGVIRP